MTVAQRKPESVFETWSVECVVAALQQKRKQWRLSQNRNADRRNREFPSFHALESILLDLLGILFPLRLGPDDLNKDAEDYYVAHTLHKTLTALHGQVVLELDLAQKQYEEFTQGSIAKKAQVLVADFAEQLPDVRGLIDADVVAAFRGDPAASSVDEVLLCYPGIYAIIHQRLAHLLYQRGLPMIARMMTEIAHRKTGIDIHPGAVIGPGFFIDHGTGVVIGESSVIGQNVRIYQAVTLGAKRFNLADDGSLIKGEARHPIVEDDVVIYAGATILGRVRIGTGSIIGGNVWLTEDIAPNSRITQANLTQQPLQGGG